MSSTVLTQTQAPPKPIPVAVRENSINQIAIVDLHPSKTNPRKSYDQESLNGLAENIRSQGVLQPILARPIAKGYEIVAGHRRVMAAAIAELGTVPVLLRDLNDLEVVEIQNSENEQREDVKAIEQGRGYQQWIEQLAKKDPDARRQDLIEKIAKQIGKSVRHVYSRIQLTALIPELQESLDKGKIDSSHADLLVRIGPKEQKAIYEDYFSPEATEDADGAELISVRGLQYHIECDFKPLKKAPWKLDDATVQPVCSSCEHNTANNGGDAKKPSCSNGSCYENKLEQFIKIQVPALEVRCRKTAVKVSKSSYSAPKGALKAGDWKKAPTNSCDSVVPAIEVGSEGETISVYTVCTNNKCEKHFSSVAASSSSSRNGGVKLSAEELKKKAEREAKEKADLAGDVTVVKMVLAQVKTLGSVELALLVENIANYADIGDDGLGVIAEVFGWPAPQGSAYRQFESWWKKYGAKLSVIELGKLVVASIICEAIGDGYGNFQREHLDKFAAHYKLDAKAIRKQAADAMLQPAPKTSSQVQRATASKKAAGGSHPPHPTPVPPSPLKKASKPSPRKATKKAAKKAGRK